MGRFVATPGLLGVESDLNFYAYVEGNPISLPDLSGTSPIGAGLGLLFGGALNLIANAGKYDTPGGPTMLDAFIGGEVGGFLGGLIDNPFVGAGLAGSLTYAITNWDLPAEELAAGTVATGLIDGFAGGIGGSVLGKLGANEIAAFMGGYASGILGEDIFNAFFPSAIAAPSSHVNESCP